MSHSSCRLFQAAFQRLRGYQRSIRQPPVVDGRAWGTCTRERTERICNESSSHRRGSLPSPDPSQGRPAAPRCMPPPAVPHPVTLTARRRIFATLARSPDLRGSPGSISVTLKLFDPVCDKNDRGTLFRLVCVSSTCTPWNRRAASRSEEHTS